MTLRGRERSYTVSILSFAVQVVVAIYRDQGPVLPCPPRGAIFLVTGDFQVFVRISIRVQNVFLSHVGKAKRQVFVEQLISADLRTYHMYIRDGPCDFRLVEGGPVNRSSDGDKREDHRNDDQQLDEGKTATTCFLPWQPILRPLP